MVFVVCWLWESLWDVKCLDTIPKPACQQHIVILCLKSNTLHLLFATCRCDWVVGFVVRLFVWFGWLGGWVRLETESLPGQDKVKVAAPLRFEMKRIWTQIMWQPLGHWDCQKVYQKKNGLFAVTLGFDSKRISTRAIWHILWHWDCKKKCQNRRLCNSPCAIAMRDAENLEKAMCHMLCHWCSLQMWL